MADRLFAVARERGVSLNQAALVLLRSGAGLGEPRRSAHIIGSSMDSLIGTWSEREEEAFLKAIEMFEKVDPALWQ